MIVDQHAFASSTYVDLEKKKTGQPKSGKKQPSLWIATPALNPMSHLACEKVR